MIKVKVQKEADVISSIKITGHANSGAYGQDLVCAGVSCIAVGMLNALDELAPIDSNSFIYQDGHIEIQNAPADEKTQLLLKTLLIQLQAVELVHKKFIKITIQEV